VAVRRLVVDAWLLVTFFFTPLIAKKECVRWTMGMWMVHYNETKNDEEAHVQWLRKNDKNNPYPSGWRRIKRTNILFCSRISLVASPIGGTH